jgi:hypothetical protein
VDHTACSLLYSVPSSRPRKSSGTGSATTQITLTPIPLEPSRFLMSHSTAMLRAASFFNFPHPYLIHSPHSIPKQTILSISISQLIIPYSLHTLYNPSTITHFPHPPLLTHPPPQSPPPTPSNFPSLFISFSIPNLFLPHPPFLFPHPIKITNFHKLSFLLQPPQK